MKPNIRLMAAAGLSALLLVSLQFSHQDSQKGLEVADNSSSSVSEVASLVTSKKRIPVTPQHEIAPNLEFSGKQFALYKGLKDVLDNLILGADSTDKNTILALAQNWCLQQELSISGCQLFEALFGRYIDYKLALAHHESTETNSRESLEQIHNRLQALQDLRYRWFSEEEIAVLFTDDQQLNQQALARRQIAMDKDLSREQKIQLLAEHLEQLPDEQRVPLEPTLQMHSLEQIKHQYSDKQLRLLEVETKFGYEAALRLEKTWQKQEAFQTKIQEIARQYQALQADESLALQKQQVALLEKHFSGNELRRARAILKNM